MGSAAFSAYASGGVHTFATPARRRAGSASPANLGENEAEARSAPPALAAQNGEDEGEAERDKQVSFGERLRSQKDDDEGASDDEKKLDLREQESK